MKFQGRDRRIVAIDKGKHGIENDEGGVKLKD